MKPLAASSLIASLCFSSQLTTAFKHFSCYQAFVMKTSSSWLVLKMWANKVSYASSTRILDQQQIIDQWRCTWRLQAAYFVMFMTVAALKIKLLKIYYYGKKSPSVANELSWQLLKFSSCPVVQCVFTCLQNSWQEKAPRRSIKPIIYINDELTQIEKFSFLLS